MKDNLQQQKTATKDPHTEQFTAESISQDRELISKHFVKSDFYIKKWG